MDTLIDAELIGVKVENGHVELFGTVESLEERALANTIASTVVGVQSVMNAIPVKPKVSQDQPIKNSIKLLLQEINIHSPKISRSVWMRALSPLKVMFHRRKINKGLFG